MSLLGHLNLHACIATIFFFLLLAELLFKGFYVVWKPFFKDVWSHDEDGLLGTDVLSLFLVLSYSLANKGLGQMQCALELFSIVVLQNLSWLEVGSDLEFLVADLV